jgi:hypothetical protein
MDMIPRGAAFLFLACSALLLCVGAASARPEKAKILYSFCTPAACADAEDVPNPVISDSAGNLFGTTLGGVNYQGAAYELRRRKNGSYEYQLLHVFAPPMINPIGALIMDTQGNLYGVAEGFDQSGNFGRIFELSQQNGQWIETALYNFCPQGPPCQDGGFPPAGLAYANQRSGLPYDGKSPLFGVTKEGGAHAGGTVFEMQRSKKGWVHSKLYDFCSSGSDCADGDGPEAQLLIDASGNLFGVTTYGGKNGGPAHLSGTAFELSPAGTTWTQTVLYSFCSTDSCADGAYPQSPLTFDSTGNLYGFTTAGGAPCALRKQYDGCGVAYKILPAGANSQETVLHDFCSETCQDGAYPESIPFLDGDGNLFGTTLAGGILKDSWLHVGSGAFFEFSLADPDNTFRVLHRFCQKTGCSDGAIPLGFIGDPSEAVIGVTTMGGTYGGGTVFRLTP